MDSRPSDWQSIASRKRAQLRELLTPFLPKGFSADKIPEPSALPNCIEFVKHALGEQEREITESIDTGISPILAKLADGRLKAIDATRAFAQRAAVAHLLTNCLSEILFQQAIGQAKELDAHLQRTGRPIGPLHGLPISVKDQFRVEGAETSLGYVGYLGRIECSEDESLIVRHLKALGGVVIAKTNVPTSLMAIETDNNIVGFTLNPHNRLLSSGGSSGGEAALLALKGSAIGLGSDFAASIRLPASINGICGLKPSHGRLPYLRVANSMEGQEINNSVVGPMGRNIDDVELITRVLLSQKPWLDDPCTLRLPWRHDETDEVHRLASRRQLTFAVLRNDGLVVPHPPVREWDPPSHAEAFSLLIDSFLIDGGADIHAAAALSGEPLVPQLSAYYGATAGDVAAKSLSETWEMVKRRKAYQAAYLAYWNSTAQHTRSNEPVDFVILPCSATPSFRRLEALYPGYTGVVSLLNFSSIAIPAGKVDKQKDPKVERSNFLGDLDKSVWTQYDPELFHNTPIGLQIMGRQLEEEKVLAAALEVQRCIATL